MKNTLKINKQLGTFKTNTSFLLESGVSLPELTCQFETYGNLNVAASNAILIFHSLSFNAHMASHNQNPIEGWWENLVGPGKPIDTRKYFVICINMLGSCMGSTGPLSINPLTCKAYQGDFPDITISDMVNAQIKVLDALNIKKCFSVIGASMGGMLTLDMAVNHPHRLKKFMVISSAPKSYPANRAMRQIQRQAIMMDPSWNKGFYRSNPKYGLMNAIQLACLQYKDISVINTKFKSHEEVDNYLNYVGEKFVNHFDANSYLCLINAMDSFDLCKHGNPYKKITAKGHLVSVSSDKIYSSEIHQKMANEMRQAGVSVTYSKHLSNSGHDAFLIDTRQIAKLLGTHLSEYPTQPKIKPFLPQKSVVLPFLQEKQLNLPRLITSLRQLRPIIPRI